MRPFVLRREACLECALRICRGTIADFLILWISLFVVLVGVIIAQGALVY